MTIIEETTSTTATATDTASATDTAYMMKGK